MNKELTPLEALKELKKRYGKNFSVQDDERTHIIETALKRLKEIDNSPKIILGKHQGQTKSMIDYVCKNWKEVRITNLEDENKLKALEIIKEKEVDVGFLKETMICYGDKWGLEHYNVSQIEYTESAKELTQEEYDLLKEWLK